jgi:membrane protein YqaA with SNARE-associated domain
MTDYLVALGVGLASGLLPIVNVEAYLVGVGLLAPAHPPWLIGAPAAVGQVVGKLVYYYAARESLRPWPWLRLRSPWMFRRGAAWAGRWRARAEARPRWWLGMLGVSAFAGLPPFGVMSAIAGGVRLHVGHYLLIGLPARCARFTLLILAPGYMLDLFGLR